MREAFGTLMVWFIASSFASGPAHASDNPAAVAACRKHVESMLREATATSYDEPVVEQLDPQTLRVAGGIVSRSASGETTRAGFRCEAKRYGLVWSTRMELRLPR